MQIQTKQTIEQKIMNAKQKVVLAQEKVTIAEKEVARVQTQKNMYEKFQKLMEASELQNRYNSASSYTCGTGPALGLHELIYKIDPAAALLEKCQLNYCLLSMNQRDRYNLAYEYMAQIANRIIKQETYESILNGTEPALGGYLQTIIRRKKPTLLERILKGGKK